MSIDTAAVRNALSELRDPESGRNLGKTQQIASIDIQGDAVRIVLQLTTHSWPIRDDFIERVRETVAAKVPDGNARQR